MSDTKKGCFGCLTLIVLSVVFATVCTVVIGQTAQEIEPVSVPRVSDEAKDFAVSAIMDYEGVRDAGVFQEGRDLNLVIIVDYAINEDYARQLGDNFVRLVKSFSQDESPGKDIGQGIYDYLVGVYYPNEQQVVIGAKAAGAVRISW